MNTSKQEAQKRLDAMQKEMDELRKIIEAPDKLKEIDWSKLPKDTLICLPSSYKYYMPHTVSLPVYDETGRDSNTKSHFRFLSYIDRAKLIENPKFTVWEGGECPVPEGVMVEIILRTGVKCLANGVNWWRWEHLNSMFDIIAYRIIGVAEGYTPFFKGLEF